MFPPKRKISSCYTDFFDIFSRLHLSYSLRLVSACIYRYLLVVEKLLCPINAIRLYGLQSVIEQECGVFGLNDELMHIMIIVGLFLNLFVYCSTCSTVQLLTKKAKGIRKDAFCFFGCGGWI